MKEKSDAQLRSARARRGLAVERSAVMPAVPVPVALGMPDLVLVLPVRLSVIASLALSAGDGEVRTKVPVSLRGIAF
ncbi:MAG: hypothetical protein ABJA84_09445 [Polaromonas sp.]